MRRLSLTALCALALLACIGAAQADTIKGDAAPAETTEFKPKVVAVFKNGLGFFIRTGEATINDGWGTTRFVPEALMGTFWMSTLAPNRYVQEIVAYNESIDDHPKCRTVEELLRANIGKRVRIVRHNNETIEGELLHVGEGDGEGAVQIASRFGEVMVFARNQIQTVEFVGEYETERKSSHHEKRIKFKLSGDGDTAPVAMSYLSKGVTWVPSYLVNIEDDEKARITFKSVLVNDSEDLEDVDLVFVVGVPNFAFSDHLSPMSLQRNVQQIVEGLRGGASRANYGILSNVATQAVFYADAATPLMPAIDAGYDTSVGTPGQAEEDLFLYSKQAVTIKKGERAAYSIFHDEVDYEHVYEWAVQDTSGVDPWGQKTNTDDRQLNAVWHSLRLTNSTDYPWTTAPAMTVSGDKPLAQDTLTYTPVGGKRNLKLTVATDVTADKREEETDREHGIEINKHDYDLVSVDGELSVINYKSDDIKLTVRKNLTGEVTVASDDAKIRKTTQNLTGVNPQSRIEWEIELGVGETAKLTYSYEVYVRT